MPINNEMFLNTSLKIEQTGNPDPITGRAGAVLSLFFYLLVFFLSPAWASAKGHQGVPEIAIYNDQGVWKSGRIMIENLLDTYGVSWREVNAADINSGNFFGQKVLWIPGGWAYDYRIKINDQGYQNIRNFVAQGGSYIGTCAGAFFASDWVYWDLWWYPYDLDLFAGQALGPMLSLTPKNTFTLAAINLDPGHPMNAGLNPNRRQIYYDGPYFLPYPTTNISPAGRYGIDGTTLAIITFSYGQGRVVLTAVHPEIGLVYTQCDCATPGAAPDDGADWPYAWALTAYALGRSGGHGLYLPLILR